MPFRREVSTNFCFRGRVECAELATRHAETCGLDFAWQCEADTQAMVRKLRGSSEGFMRSRRDSRGLSDIQKASGDLGIPGESSRGLWKPKEDFGDSRGLKRPQESSRSRRRSEEVPRRLWMPVETPRSTGKPRVTPGSAGNLYGANARPLGTSGKRKSIQNLMGSLSAPQQASGRRGRHREPQEHSRGLRRIK